MSLVVMRQPVSLFFMIVPLKVQRADAVFVMTVKHLIHEKKPRGNAIEMASSLGIEILTEQQYRELQGLGEFDKKTSSWVKTPAKIRDLGGALFCDRRYNHVFVYHNGAESYYAARGFRGRIKV